MQRIGRLLYYMRPYTLAALASVVLMAAVGLLDAFRVVLIGPIFDRVLNPAVPHDNIVLFTLPRYGEIRLEGLVPPHFHNAWTVVAFSLVAATLLKALCDYLGTYLINYAGFGLITDLRNQLYEAILRRSAGFFHKHSTGTLLS